jgi:L-rhamnose mutarotase
MNGTSKRSTYAIYGIIPFIIKQVIYLAILLNMWANIWSKDMLRMAEDPKTEEWWKVTDPCQEPIDDRQEGEGWASM